MATGKALDGKPYAGNPHVRFDEGEVAPAATPRRGSLLYKHLTIALIAAALLGGCRETPVWNKAEQPLALPFESTVVVTGSDITCSFAVKELNEIVRKACGQAFRTGQRSEVKGQTVDKKSQPLNSPHRILLGRTPEAEAILGAGFFEGGADYRSETSCVFAKDGDLYLVGSDAAGTLWSVYDFVEDSLGYRWYQMCRDDLRAKNEVFLGQRSEAEGQTKDGSNLVFFNGIASRRRPGFTGFRRDHENYGYFRLFRLRHRSNSEIANFVPGYRFLRDWKTPGHGFDMYLPRNPKDPWMGLKCVPAEVKALAPAFKKHPEWFSLDANGKRSDKMQLCLSSKATRDALWQSLQWWVKKNGKGTYMIGSNDDHTGTYCYCKDCLALNKKYGGQCGPLWFCVLDLCNRLKAAKMDGVYITSLAYRHQTQLCPPNLTFPDNFVCDYAPVTWDRALGEVKPEKLPDGRVYDYLENCRDWCKACPGGVSYWFYGDGSQCAFTWGRVSREIREIYEAGVRSAGLCGHEGGYEFEDLMHHMWFWCLYNPEGDARAEYARAVASKYGPAANDIMAYTDALEKLRRRVVAKTETGCGAAGILGFSTAEERREMSAILGRAAAKVATAGADHRAERVYAENVSWARISLDVTMFFKDNDLAAEKRARAASESYVAKVGGPKLMQKGNRVVGRLDVMANYANLRPDAPIPPELAKYPKEKVHRILPPKARAFKGYVDSLHQRTYHTSEPDPDAVCGFAITDELPDAYAPLGASQIRIGLYEHAVGRYFIPFQKGVFPKGFWEKDKYKMYCLGRSRYGSTVQFVWTDANGFTGLGPTPLACAGLMSRYYDNIILDKQFETWISVKGEGPKFFKDDTRPNKIFIEQVFTVEL